MSATRRLTKELQELRDADMHCFKNIEVDETNILVWQGLILPDNEPYNKGAFRVELTFPAEYPFRPPKVSARVEGIGLRRSENE